MPVAPMSDVPNADVPISDVPMPAAQDADLAVLTRPVGRLVLSTALPMTVVLSMGGLLTLVDGIFVGRYVGPAGLTAVSAAFPVVMLLTALTALAGGGMASRMARHLGAGRRAAAGADLAAAHGLALGLSLALMLAALLAGPTVVAALTPGAPALSEAAARYLGILILGTPIQFALGLQADALRTEGRAGQIALLSVLTNLVNGAANYIAIVWCDLGVAGSALGTLAAQGIGLAMVLTLRAHDPALLPLSALRRESWWRGWGALLRLGLPLSLSFIGMALVAATVLLALGRVAAQPFSAVAGYGITTRLLGLAFLPAMALALTCQSLAGTQAGAGLWRRARQVRQLTMGAALGWCLLVTALGQFAGAALAALFTGDPQVIAATAALLRPMTLLYALNGPILVLALYFQALGHPGRTALLTLLKPWLLTPGLVLGLSALAGEAGLHLAFPLADGLLALLTLGLLRRFGTAPTQEARA